MTAKSVNPGDLFKGHRERLRERLKRDPANIADYEALEMLLGMAIPRKDTKPIALALISRFRNLRGVLDARPDELADVEGFGSAAQSLWRLLREIMARYEASPLWEREVLASPEAVVKMARFRLGSLPGEECWLALVDARNRLIYWERLRVGGVSSVVIQPRDVLEIALLHKAAGLILVHNHPGGHPQPSQSDIELTRELEILAPRLGLRFLDHLIVTAGDCYSVSNKKIFR